MRRCHLAVLAVLVAVCASAGLALAEESSGLASAPLERRDWWPFLEGPHYGDLPDPLRLHPRVIRLEVGSFDTRGAGLAVPEALRMPDDAGRRASAPWLVQLQGPVTETAKEMLRARGVRLLHFYPSNAFVVKSAGPTTLAGIPGVLWAGPFHPAYRIEPLLGHSPTFDPQLARNETIPVRALLFEAGDRDRLLAWLDSAGAVVDRVATFAPGEWPDRVYFTAAPRVILDAARRDDIRWVEEVSRTGFTLNAESKVVVQSGSIASGTPYWDAGVDGSTQVLGDMDNGMDVDTVLLSHTAADAGAPGPAHRKVQAYTAWGGGDLLSCGNYSHGTNTAQCAVGNRTDFGQNGELEGVAKGARVVFQDLSPSGTIACLLGQLSPPASLVSLYDQVRAHGGHLTNGSFSICSGYGSHALDVDQYSWDHKDFLGFFSAGNGGNGLVCPGTAKNVIAAGGHYQDPFANEFYGSTGPAPDGRMGPTVMAPACDHSGGNPAPYAYNTSASLQSSDTNLTGVPEAVLSQGSCGTSFSSPYAMGAAALVRDYFEKGYWPGGAASAGDAFAPSAALVKAVLLNSGEHMSCCGSFMQSTTTWGQGMGRLNLARTLAIAGDARTPQGLRVVDRGMAAGLATGGVHDEVVEITDPTKPLRATLNWTDRPGSALVNNLRLTVIGPAGGPAQTYHGRNFSGQYTLSEGAGGTADDTVNPFEAVFVQASELVAGPWTIRVEGTNVPNGDPLFGNTQPFAVVVSGGFASTAVREVSGPGSASPLVATSSAGTDVSWQWESVVGVGVTYSFYRGTLPAPGSWTYSHALIDAAHCGVASNSTVVGDREDGIDRYYLVAMKQGGTEGSLGTDSAGTPRPPASPACP